MINLYYNFYVPNSGARATEVLSCLAVTLQDPSIDRVVLIGATGNWQRPAGVVELLPEPARPSFRDYFDIASRYSGPDDINIIINSDCFLDPATTRLVNRIRSDEAYCISRSELKRLMPLVIDEVATDSFQSVARYCAQDAWVFRGPPRAGMWLDFFPGVPGCDNRLAFELRNVGYRILDPCLTIRVMHYHSSNERPAGNIARVPEPYAYPVKSGWREKLKELRWRVEHRIKPPDAS